MNKVKKMRYVWLRRAGWMLCVLLSLTPQKAFARARTPAWLQAHLDGSLKMRGVYYGVSFAPFKEAKPGYDDMRLARDRALDELCYRLSVSIKSQFEQNLAQKGDYSEEQVASSLFVSSRKVFSGIEEKEKWTDAKKLRHWVMVVIDKEKADRQLEEQKFINEVVDRLERKQDEILEGIKKIGTVLSQNMQVYTDRMDHFEGLLAEIDTKVGAAGDQTRQEYASINEEIKKFESGWKTHKEKLESSQERQSRQMEQLMRQNQQLQNLLVRIAGKIQGDYFLAFANDDVRYKTANPDFSVRIEPEKGQGADYYSGEEIRFRVRASRGCYIKLIYVSSTQEGADSEKRMNILLFPNEHDRDNWVRAGQTTVIGKLGELEVRPPFGRDVITVVASEKQFSDIEEILKQARGGFYSELTTNTSGAIRMRSRGLGVVQPASSPVPAVLQTSLPLSPAATDTCFIVSHAR
ncbi:MAG: DUF4384 domain-containing protein [Desulfobacterales bacterium]|nr:DUF4384 domain-containing protein [Desulfobacterales bacterium]